MSSSSKYLRTILDYAREYGFEIVRQSKHVVLRYGDKTVTVSRTPRCPHALQNAMNDIRKARK